MKLPDKTCRIEEAIARIGDGATVMVGGFGVPGTPMTLIHALVEHGARGLTLIKNDANEPGMGIDHLLQAGQVSRLITTHLGLNGTAIALMNSGALEVEFNAQGILAERIRAGGAGLGAILSDIGIGTELALGKQVVEMEGKPYLVEPALRADVALIHADRADTFGNLAYVATAQNFNPLMAMAATCVIAEAERLVPLGALDANDVHTPGVFVDHVAELSTISGEYGVVQR
ncbi:CoA transferase subunit A [Ponticoccus sp. SC2-23]|uniref:CoA transferase subunit A n=1 Tax=Alexandriicola marinus TaxID=2081710 RepID=UPI000FD97160|nr:CoA transferase subunit A [Alexandriicola marinus]MBM1220960.1 CoA transferase subunit A [Ponticoccus sp. SC6-9]MBM1225530.1 CoA transferase subunit A [Ponticoccus sp. SC6-15]MBM1227713.1 CoA transferase subunit A [Ponticoccus sp. SC6-38]MBM1234649.1 CoA transferase subunit A [Ponticoccus sp. SC6-45]MBM1238215.1 CoA transferase subunit A [Ponticoccus sp. SC6-49]MBM1244152.1 CoA transferase subunit A [Ponticoccus sp. SC2-64]MBM1248173.1 CoA transferase subunit A [Ponticoccus sp. SC6-42]MB